MANVGVATFGKRQTRCVFCVCDFFTHTYTSVMHRRNGRVTVSELVHMGTIFFKNKHKCEIWEKWGAPYGRNG